MNRFNHVFAIVLLTASQIAKGQDVTATAVEIRTEATRSQAGGIHPLPLAAHWNAGHLAGKEGWGPRHQMELIAEGHFLLPWFDQPQPDATVTDAFRAYYEEPIKKARELQLPIVFISSQWERLFATPAYLTLPEESNPNFFDLDGKQSAKACPFGPIEPWTKVGMAWTSSPAMQALQEWYPDPPLVVFLSNNEHPKVTWPEVEKSKRYIQKYGRGKDDDFKRRVVGDGWIERYRALQKGLSDGLKSQAWRDQAKFVAYNAFGPEFIGRWPGWQTSSLTTKQRVSPDPFMWDGGSPSYYTNDFDNSNDYSGFGPQVAFQNVIFMQQDALAVNPEFWFELSFWDGYDGAERAKKYTPKPEFYRQKGQTYDPKRYHGFVQFGAWLTRPRVLREYRGHVFSPEEGMPYFMSLVEAVDRVHTNPTLREFWQQGKLVPNRAHPHPYQNAVPDTYAKADRWFMLDADVNTARQPWSLTTNFEVFSLALVQGNRPARRWLVYAHSPIQDRKNVKITIPQYRQITINAPREGAFYLVDEKANRVQVAE